MARSGKREAMAAALKEWRQSGESAVAFCRRRRMKPQKLSYWKRVLGGGLQRRRARAGSVAGFVPVQVVNTAGGVALEIHLAGGEWVVFPQGGSLTALGEVVALLRGRC